MSGYIMLINYTDQGIRNIRDSPNRAQAARELARSLGAEMKDLYLTMGGYDLVCTVEADSDEAIAKLTLALGSAGNVRTTTLRAFTEQEFKDIVDSLP